MTHISLSYAMALAELKQTKNWSIQIETRACFQSLKLNLCLADIQSKEGSVKSWTAIGWPKVRSHELLHFGKFLGICESDTAMLCLTSGLQFLSGIRSFWSRWSFKWDIRIYRNSTYRGDVSIVRHHHKGHLRRSSDISCSSRWCDGSGKWCDAIDNWFNLMSDGLLWWSDVTVIVQQWIYHPE